MTGHHTTESFNTCKGDGRFNMLSPTVVQLTCWPKEKVMNQGKDSLWGSFLLAILTRLLVGAVIGSIGGGLMDFRRILAHLAEGDLKWAMTPIIMGATIGALIACVTVPRYLWPWAKPVVRS